MSIYTLYNQMFVHPAHHTIMLTIPFQLYSRFAVIISSTHLEGFPQNFFSSTSSVGFRSGLCARHSFSFHINHNISLWSCLCDQGHCHAGSGLKLQLYSIQRHSTQLCATDFAVKIWGRATYGCDVQWCTYFW